MTGDVKYPDVHVQLTGESDNAFAILGNVRQALKKAGVSKAEVDSFLSDAKSGDYDHLLQTCMRYVDVS